MLSNRQTIHYWVLIILLNFTLMFHFPIDGIWVFVVGICVAVFSYCTVKKLIPPPANEESDESN
jgi:hypothetical protein